jgi:hypothetical protein
MDFTKPLLSGLAATIVGTVGTLLVTLSPAIPAPWSFFVGLAGFLACAMAGLSARPPVTIEGSAKLQGAALSVAVMLGGALTQFWPMIPAGWPQSVALAVAAIVSWLTGHVLPMLGSTAGNPAFVDASRTPILGGARGAAEVLTRAGR